MSAGLEEQIREQTERQSCRELQLWWNGHCRDTCHYVGAQHGKPFLHLEKPTP